MCYYNSTNVWYQWHRDLLLAVLDIRCSTNVYLLQSISIAYDTNLLKDITKERLFVNSAYNRDAYHLFEMLTLQLKEIKVNDVYLLPSYLHVYHPLLTANSNKIKKIKILNIFNSNAKPILLGFILQKT